MKTMTSEQFDTLVKNAPPGTSQEGIRSALISRGYSIEEKKKDGMLKSIIKGVLKTPLRAIVTAGSAVEGAFKLAKGDVAGANKAMEGVETKTFGQLKPFKIGQDVDSDGTGGYFGKNTIESLGAGAELGSYVVGSGVTGRAVSSAFKVGGIKSASKLLGQAVKYEALAGGTGGAGMAMQEEDATLGSVFFKGLFGAGVGAVIAPVALGAGVGANKFMKGGTQSIEEIAPEFGAKVAEKGTGNTTFRQKLVGISPSTKNLVESAPDNALDSWERNVSIAKESAINPRVKTPLENAGGYANTALTKLKAKMKSVADKKNTLLGEAEKTGVKASQEELGVIVDGLDEQIENRFGVGISYNDAGEEIFIPASGRASKLDASDLSALTDFRNKIKTIIENPNVQYLDDLVEGLNSDLFKKSQNTAMPVNSSLANFMKMTVKNINEIQQNAVGKKFIGANSEYAQLKTVYDWLNKGIGVRASKGGALMKRVFSPSDAETKTMFEAIRQLTGIDLIQEATFAKMAMEIAGDARQKSLLEQLSLSQLGSKDVISRLIGALESGAKYVGKKSGYVDPESVIRDMIKNAMKDQGIPIKSVQSKAISREQAGAVKDIVKKTLNKK